MKELVVLVDFENVQKPDLARLPAHARIKIFDGNGPNALDFHIACHLGEGLARTPQAEFVVVSRDTGFDPLLRHLKARGLHCRREAPATPAKAAPKPVLDANAQQVATVIDQLTAAGKIAGMDAALVYHSDEGGVMGRVYEYRRMSQLFARERSVITKHVRNVFREGELEAGAICAKFAHTADDGKTYQVEHYNLDVIISVGYRVKSSQGTRFRQWATRVLREHLVQGYTFNQTRLAERGLLEARQTLDLLAHTLQNQALVDDTGRAVLELFVGYADTWRLLLEYDEGRLALPPGGRPSSGVLDFARASAKIAEFKQKLMARNEATPLFGNPRGEALEGILGSIEQTIFGESLYRSREEKAAARAHRLVDPKNRQLTKGM